jgi:hypothetical protein
MFVGSDIRESRAHRSYWRAAGSKEFGQPASVGSNCLQTTNFQDRRFRITSVLTTLKLSALPFVNETALNLVWSIERSVVRVRDMTGLPIRADVAEQVPL